MSRSSCLRLETRDDFLQISCVDIRPLHRHDSYSVYVEGSCSCSLRLQARATVYHDLLCLYLRVYIADACTWAEADALPKDAVLMLLLRSERTGSELGPLVLCRSFGSHSVNQ